MKVQSDIAISSGVAFRAADAFEAGRVERATKRAQEAKVPTDTSKAELKNLSKEFESLVVQMMIKSMRDSVPQEDSFMGDGSNQVDTYRSLLDEEYSKKVSERGGFGLADTLYRQLLQREGLSPTEGTASGTQNVNAVGEQREDHR